MRILVTAGGTREYIDPVRYITNASSGRMGYAVAQRADELGHEVVLISAPTNIAYPRHTRIIDVETSAEMFEQVRNEFPLCDCLVMCAAVADYTPETVSDRKIKKQESEILLRLKPTADIIKWASRNKRDDQMIVGFALEDKDVLENALAKMKRKNMDVIVANKPEAISGDGSKVFIKNGDEDWREYPERHKSETAIELMKIIEQFFQKTGNK
ncbi:MAG: phosphopantothenoylcysteine decarboxylase [Phycisphaerae bacterium]